MFAQSALPFPVKFNEITKGEVEAIISGNDVVIPIADLERFGVQGVMWQRIMNLARLSGATRPVKSAEGVSLRALGPWITYNFDEATLSLSITAVPQLLAPTELRVTDVRPADIVYSRDNSTYLNYSATTGGGHTALFGETGTSVRGNLLFNSFSRPAGGPFVRLLTNFSMDDRSRLQRRTLGDAFTISESLGSSVLLGGVTVARSYSIDPYFVRYPPFNFRGMATTPAHVDVYINGIRVAQQDVPPGPFDLRNLPVSGGSGNAVFVIRDAFGREERFSDSFYYSTAVLARGLSEYSYSAGALRKQFGAASFDYGAPAVSAFHRYGVTDSLTAGGHAEATRQRWSGGPSLSLRTRAGDFQVASSYSDDHGNKGDAEELSYRFTASRFGVSGDVRRFSRRFSNLSLRASDDRSLLETNIAATLSALHASWTLQWTSSDVRDQLNRDRINLYVSFPLSNRLSAYVSGGSARMGSERKPELFAGLSVYLGSTGANLTFTKTGSHTEAGVDVQRNLPIGTGYGYRLQSTSAEGNQAGSAVLQYQTGFGRYEMQIDPYHVSHSPTISASGGAVYQKGTFELTRAVQDSYALVRVPGVENVRVYSSNILIGRTDGNGDLLVPNLLAYYGNRLRIEDRDIPMSYEVKQVEKTIAPPYRGGAFVEFPVKRIQTVTGTVVIRTGTEETVPSFGQLTLTANADSFVSPLGRGGEFYFENITAGKYQALVELAAGGSCTFTMTLSERAEPAVKLGQLVCTSQEKHP